MPEQAQHSRTVLCCAFDGRRLTPLRHTIAECAAACGLACGRLDGFVLAVSEMMINVVRHGGGRGELEICLNGAVLTCVITDRGPGIPDWIVRSRSLPPALAPTGRGLWVARQLCDEMTVVTGPGGTAVRLGMATG